MSELEDKLKEEIKEDIERDEKFVNSINNMRNVMSAFWVKFIIITVILFYNAIRNVMIMILPAVALFGVVSLQYTAFGALCMLLFQMYQAFVSNRYLLNSVK